MFRQSMLLANLILVSVFLFNASEALRLKRNPEIDSAADLPPADPRCANNTGELFKQDCNNCWCVAHGVVACERKLCPQFPGVLRITPVNPSPDPRCGTNNNNGESWKDDCNSCWCVADGRVACTRKFCVKVPEGSAIDTRCDAYVENEIISFKNDCNNCVCVGKGFPACTRMRCEGAITPEPPADAGVDILKPGNVLRTPPEFLPGASALKDPHCIGGNLTTTWKQDCNTCFCVGDGVGACTLIGCMPAQPVGEAGATKVKRDTKDLIKAFSGDEEQADAPYRGPVRSSGSDVYPGVWTATAALSAITAVLARI